MGEGSFGCVYFAVDRQAGGTKVAVKAHCVDLDAGEGYPFELVREVDALAHCRGLAHVVQLREVVDGRFLVLEAMERDLHAERKRQGGILPKQDSLNVMRQIYDGLAHLHAMGIWHRDLKPQNCLVRGDVVKISDLGASRHSEKEAGFCYTRDNCTLWYRSPEQILGRGQYDGRVDVWSAACIHVEMRIGRSPFPGDRSEMHQLACIFRTCGTPDEGAWPGVTALEHFRSTLPQCGRDFLFDGMDSEEHEYVAKGLAYAPYRATAAEMRVAMGEEEAMQRVQEKKKRKASALGESNRRILVEWMIEVSQAWSLRMETVTAALALLDKSVFGVGKERLQLVAVTCLMMAAKMHDTNFPSIHACVAVCADLYTAQEVVRCEAHLMSTHMVRS